MAELTCIVVTPETTALEEPASFVALPLHDGEIGIAPNHAPMIARLGFGELRLQRANAEIVRYYVDGGFVQIAENVVSVLTNRAIPASELDVEEAHEHLATAIASPTDTEEHVSARERAIHQAQLESALPDVVDDLLRSDMAHPFQ